MENKKQVQKTAEELRQDNIRLVNTLHELRAKKERLAALVRKFESIGTITQDIIARKYLASSDIFVKNRTYQMALCIRDETSEPMVVLEDRAFILSWDDIIELAEFVGLFDEVEE